VRVRTRTHSGCVTSAESVLLEQQSTDEVLARLRDTNTRVVISVAPQPLAALAAHFAADVVEVGTAPETRPN